MFDGKNTRVSPDGVGPGHVANCVKGVREGSLQHHYVLDHGCGTRGNHLGRHYLEGRFEGVTALGGKQCRSVVEAWKVWLRDVCGQYL